jgi:hypothetical protein
MSILILIVILCFNYVVDTDIILPIVVYDLVIVDFVVELSVTLM